MGYYKRSIIAGSWQDSSSKPSLSAMATRLVRDAIQKHTDRAWGDGGAIITANVASDDRPYIVVLFRPWAWVVLWNMQVYIQTNVSVQGLVQWSSDIGNCPTSDDQNTQIIYLTIYISDNDLFILFEKI